MEVVVKTGIKSKVSRLRQVVPTCVVNLLSKVCRGLLTLGKRS